MAGLLAFFQGIGNYITGIFDFVLSLVYDLVWLVGTLIWATLQVPKMILWLPTKIHALIITLFAVVMIYKFIGREG